MRERSQLGVLGVADIDLTRETVGIAQPHKLGYEVVEKGRLAAASAASYEHMGQVGEVPRQLTSERYRIEPTRRLGGQQAGNSLQAHIIAQTENVIGSANASRLGIERATYHGAKPHVLKFGELGGIAVAIVKCSDGQQVAAHEDAETERGIYTLALGAVRQRVLMRDVELVRIEEPLEISDGRAARHEAGAEQHDIQDEPERERQQRHGGEQQRQGEKRALAEHEQVEAEHKRQPSREEDENGLERPRGRGRGQGDVDALPQQLGIAGIETPASFLEHGQGTQGIRERHGRGPPYAGIPFGSRQS